MKKLNYFVTEDEMVRWHHQLNGDEFEQTPGEGEGQESLACWSPWGCKELYNTERFNNNNSIANKGPSSQGYGFSSSHVQM